MALTQATKDRRIASLEADVADAIETAARHRARAEACDVRAGALEAELEWLRNAPVKDPAPGRDDG